MIDETILSDGSPWASLSRQKIFHKNDDVCRNQYFNWLTRKVLIQCKKIPTTLRMGIVDSVIYYYRNRQWNFFLGLKFDFCAVRQNQLLLITYYRIDIVLPITYQCLINQIDTEICFWKFRSCFLHYRLLLTSIFV